MNPLPAPHVPLRPSYGDGLPPALRTLHPHGQASGGMSLLTCAG